MEVKKPLSVEEYRAKCSGEKTKVVETLNGVWEIKKITMRDYIACGGFMPSSSLDNLRSDERLAALEKQMTPDVLKKQMQVNDALIARVVIKPKVVVGKQDGCLSVEEIADEDYNALLAAINAFSWGGGEGDSLKSFCAEPSPGNAGKNG